MTPYIERDYLFDMFLAEHREVFGNRANWQRWRAIADRLSFEIWRRTI